MWEKFDEATMGIVVRHIKKSVSPFFFFFLKFSFNFFPLFFRSSGLPDNVFDAGERPAKLVQKRVKVGFLTQVILTLKIPAEPLERKGAGKSSNTSPDMPNKRQRLVFAHSSFMRIWGRSRFVFASFLSPSFVFPVGLRNQLRICHSSSRRKMYPWGSRRVCYL